MMTATDELQARLAKLYPDAGCCAAEFHQAKEGVTARDDFRMALTFFKALSDENRLALVKLLQRYAELCVCEIEAAFPLVRSTLIHHLRILMDAGILGVQKRGKWSYYRLSREHGPVVEGILQAIEANVNSKGA